MSKQQANASTLVAELDAAIALRPPLRRIEVVGCTAQAASDFALTAQRYAQNLLRSHGFISFEKLECLVVTHDLQETMLRYDTEGWWRREDDLQIAGASSGLVFNTRTGVVAAMSAGTMDTATYEPDPLMAARAGRVLVHELCHAHDMGQQHAWFVQRMTRVSAPPPQERGYSLCFSLWSEYFAQRWSYFAEADIDEDLSRLDLLLNGFERLKVPTAARHMARAMGYALGSLAGAGVVLQDLCPDLAGALRRRQLWPAWVQADLATRRLVETQDCWRHPLGLLRLQAATDMIERVCASRCLN